METNLHLHTAASSSGSQVIRHDADLPPHAVRTSRPPLELKMRVGLAGQEEHSISIDHSANLAFLQQLIKLHVPVTEQRLIWGAGPPLGRWDSQLVIGELVKAHGPSFCLLRERNRCAFCDVEDNAPYASRR